MKPLIAPLVLLISLISSSIHASDSPGASGNVQRKIITVNLESNWQETPLILEIAEFIADENKQLFWPFIDALYEKLPPGSIPSMSQGDQYDLAVTVATDVLDSSNILSLLKFALSLRFYSPTVSMFQHIAANVRPIDKCTDSDTFVQYSTSEGSQFVCSLEELKKLINDPVGNLKVESGPVEIIKNDHVFGSPGLKSPDTAVLYGQIGSASFYEFHSYLKQSALSGKHEYLVRHFTANSSESSVSLSGYGVELAIKSTEYKAVDDTRVKGEESSLTKELKEIETEDVKEVAGFVIPTLKSLHPNKSKSIDELTSYLQENTKEIANLKVWELQELSLQVANHVLTQPKEEALHVLKELVENFPIHAKKLIKTDVPRDLRREIETNQNMIMSNLNLGTSDTALFIDGMFFDMDTTDIFGLYGYLKNEMKMVAGLHSILGSYDFTQDKLNKLTRLDISSSKSEQITIDFRDSAVVFINDIESDKQYRSWPSSINDLLRPTYPGMLRNVRKNMYNLVMIVDASKKESYDLIKLAESFYVHRAPLRIGFVFITSPGSGLEVANVALLNAFNYIAIEKSNYDGLSFITDVIASTPHRDMKAEDVIKAFKSKYKNVDLNSVFGPDSDYDTGKRLTEDFLERTGLGNTMRVLLNGVILNENQLHSDLFEDAVLSEIMRQTPWIQKAVYNKEVTDDNDFTDWLMSRKNVLPRLNKHIMNTQDGKFIDLSCGPFKSKSDDLNVLSSKELLSYFLKKVKFYTRHSNHCHSVNVLLSCDLNSLKCRKLIISSLEHLIDNSQSMRLAILHRTDNVYSRLLEAANIAIKDPKVLLPTLIKILKLTQVDSPSDGVSAAGDYQKNVEEILSSSESLDRTFTLHKLISEKIFTDAGNEFVVINGRLIRIAEDVTFTSDDFNLIERYDRMSYGQKLSEHLTTFKSGDACSTLVMKVASVLLAQSNSKTRHELDFIMDKQSILKFDPMDNNSPALDVLVIFEPLSRGAQRLLPILTTLQRVINMKIRVFFNCIEKHSELPLKTFSRFVLEPELTFGADGSLLKRSALFASMPLKPLFTLAMVTPENWLVEAVRSPYDLDNIHLEEVEGKGVWADFKLEYLLLEGHCFEQSTGNPPRGLQIVLAQGDRHANVIGDTIVMANLGYFQLKAKPGSWKLALREGRSADIYQIMSYEGPDAVYNVNGNVSTLSVTISSFKSHLVKLKVNKKPGQSHKDLLAETDETEADSNSIWDSLGSWSSSKPSPPPSNDNDRVDIFSLASGHLYERLLRIMMLSVLKNTKSPVKFWFLKNYLSPTFKDLLPAMAQEYGFEYELVEYKWPRWLHQQTEKQRVIWGYKILFLDVLFPLSVSVTLHLLLLSLREKYSQVQASKLLSCT